MNYTKRKSVTTQEFLHSTEIHIHTLAIKNIKKNTYKGMV